MNDKALFAIKIIFTLGLIASLCALAIADADAFTCVKSVQARGGLNVRTGPGMEYPATYLLEDTETVIVLDELDGWVLVAKNNGAHTTLGWVCGDYLK